MNALSLVTLGKITSGDCQFITVLPINLNIEHTENINIELDDFQEEINLEIIENEIGLQIDKEDINLDIDGNEINLDIKE